MHIHVHMRLLFQHMKRSLDSLDIVIPIFLATREHFPMFSSAFAFGELEPHMSRGVPLETLLHFSYPPLPVLTLLAMTETSGKAKTDSSITDEYR